MFVVLGATGHIGANLVRALDQAGQRVIAVLHDAEKAGDMATARVEPAVVDVTDTEALRTVLRCGHRAFLLNPPADTSGDTNATELATARSITDALEGSGLEKIVVASTYGAQKGEAIGDLSVLYEFEQRAKASGIPTAIDRGAYYFTNLDMLLEPAKDGMLPTAFPAGMELPMVSPVDLAEAAYRRLVSPTDDVGIRHVEGPETYTFQDVANAFSATLGRPVTVETTPREKWEESFRDAGFSKEAARAYARMTAATVDGPARPKDPIRGSVSLQAHIDALVASGTT